jgi:hypothetical protein
LPTPPPPAQVALLNRQMDAILRLTNRLKLNGLTLAMTEGGDNQDPNIVEGKISTANGLLVWSARWNWRDDTNSWMCGRCQLVSADNTLLKAFSS